MFCTRSKSVCRNERERSYQRICEELDSGRIWSRDSTESVEYTEFEGHFICVQIVHTVHCLHGYSLQSVVNINYM